VSNANNNPLLIPNFLFYIVYKNIHPSKNLNMNNNLIIFSKYLNNKNKSLFKKESIVQSFVGKQKYTPPVSKE
jgi:hypothetical protein